MEQNVKDVYSPESLFFSPLKLLMVDSDSDPYPKWQHADPAQQPAHFNL